FFFFFFSSRRRHTRSYGDWSSDVCSSDLLSGQIISRTGRYKWMSVGALMLGTFGVFLMAGMGPDTDYQTVVRNMVLIGVGLGPRSEERRVGKECRSRGGRERCKEK